MKKRHAFHCQRCNSECTIYKKGKKHRVLVCPSCGVLATNPFALAAPLAAGAASAIGSYAVEKLTTSKKESSPSPVLRTCTTDRFTTEERVRMALGR